MSNVFDLKYRDTRPILLVYLLNPDGTAVDLTGTTVKLFITLSGGTKLIRNMVVDDTPTTGIVRYTWLATDWDEASGTTVDGAFPVGGLVVGPGTVKPDGFVLGVGEVEHRMEYEVVNGTLRLTFPNDGYDTLRVVADMGQQ